MVRLNDSFEMIPPRPGFWTDTIADDVQILSNIPYFGKSSDKVWPLAGFTGGNSPKAVYLHGQEFAGENQSGTITGIFPAITGYAYLSRDWKSITIEYSYQDTLSQKWYNDTFTGSKIW